ncbi:hypothetical protein BD626DRAFT_208704 [Schizophyllum amplum]|uniref:Methyltransferase-domain-containing protein n=1 Tax=Schizophyllum amplum TaxID=97359 RepID=A0A550BYA2_9AGAR|nr:hypothetical protein BD626DRAFT_208704 [Auriculariopsis ampla]
MLPAHLTKDHKYLRCQFFDASLELTQLDDGIVNGTALWLSGQVMSYYLAEYHPPKANRENRLCELGSGIGLTALAAATLGWQVLATDTKDVVNAVLAPNAARNIGRYPHIQVSELDWSVAPESWDWNNASAVASPFRTSSESSSTPLITPPFDLICTGDTVYSPELIEPLLRTLYGVCTVSKASKPTVLLCLERRDPAVADKLLGDAKDVWKFSVEKVPQRKLVRALEKGGVKWAKDDWDGIELYKMRLR